MVAFLLWLLLFGLCWPLALLALLLLLPFRLTSSFLGCLVASDPCDYRR